MKEISSIFLIIEFSSSFIKEIPLIFINASVLWLKIPYTLKITKKSNCYIFFFGKLCCFSEHVLKRLLTGHETSREKSYVVFKKPSNFQQKFETILHNRFIKNFGKFNFWNFWLFAEDVLKSSRMGSETNRNTSQVVCEI